MDDSTCWVCNFKQVQIKESGPFERTIDCPICGGAFKINKPAVWRIEELQKQNHVRHKVSAFIYERILHDEIAPYIVPDRKGHTNIHESIWSVEECIQSYPKTPEDIMNRILLNLYKMNSKPGGVIRLILHKVKHDYDVIAPALPSCYYGIDSQERSFYLNALQNAEFIHAHPLNDIGNNKSEQRIILNLKGFNKILDLLKRGPRNESLKVFVALAFKNKDAYINAIKPALLYLGFEPICLVDHRHNDNIDNKIITAIEESRFIIADFTHHNPGAYYEAGFARGLGKPVIRACKYNSGKDKSKLIHFDQNHYSVLFYKSPSELFSEIIHQIKADANLGPVPPLNLDFECPAHLKTVFAGL